MSCAGAVAEPRAKPRTANMRPEAMKPFVCFILFSVLNDVNANQVKNYQSGASVNPFVSLFKDSPYAVYASAVPHGAYSFNTQTFQLPPKPSGNGHLVPIHNENIVIHKQSGYLTDSYGNKFLQTPQSIAYKATLPQQFVALQDLPAHLAQPFVPAPGFQFKQSWPQIAYGAGHINMPQAFQSRDAPIFKFGGQPIPINYDKASLLSAPLQGKFGFPIQVNVAQQPSNQKIVYSSTESYRPIPSLESAKFQRLEQAPPVIKHTYEISPPKAQLKAKPTQPTPSHEVKVTTINDGKKTVVTIPTKPSIPNLLDISLLEPLVFDNPVVPQVQHFLPKINLEPFIRTNPIQGKKQHKEFLVQNTKYYDGPIKTEQSTARYDIDGEVSHGNAPNEFNPIIPKENLHHNTERPHHGEDNGGKYYAGEPNDDSNEDSHEEDEEPKQLIYHGNFDEEERKPNHYSEDHNPPPKEHRHNEDTHQEQKQHPVKPNTHNKEKHYPKHKVEEQPKPKHHPEKHYAKDKAPKSYPKYKLVKQTIQLPPKMTQIHWEPKAPVYKIVQKPHPSYQPHVEQKSKRIIVKEETPIQTKTLREQMMAEVIKEEDNNEEDFEKAYKEAAFGFPAYNHDDNHEKDIYNPASYGAPKYYEAYDFSNSPFDQYFVGNNDSPKSSRLIYKEIRDQNTDNYFKDFSAKQPQRLGELKQTKTDYFKSYKNNKSPNYFTNIKSQKSRPEAVFGQLKTNDGRWFAQLNAKPVKYQFDYSKTGNPRDNYAHASKPSSYKNTWTTQFVEPQFQYGFEPIPKLLDSELAAMASNDSPESEVPGSRKKIYKENFYIHKTSTTGKS